MPPVRSSLEGPPSRRKNGNVIVFLVASSFGTGQDLANSAREEAMTKKVITTTLNSPLSQVAEVMAKNGIKGTPVLDDNGRLVSLVTLADVLQIHPDQRTTTTVSSVMTKELVTTIPDECLYAAFGKMTSNHIGHLSITEQEDRTKLMGIITREDVWRVYNIEIMSKLEEVKLSGSVEENSKPNF